MKKSIVIFSLLALVGCGEIQKVSRDKTYIGIVGQISEVCINGVTYLVMSKGGITPKINEEFYPYTCTTKTNDIPQ
ncbi:TPA: hypothetical protein ACY36Y_001967 [Pasteurella multocida]|uniref:hypothetical protein n=1 Tax=Pasteurella TaxID=745 RepID=UPI00147E9882|nr:MULTISPECIES: hypothetical protein [Pasteurella]MCL7770779.1 hypothetical protein [Pasteurella multocida]NNI02713.1 hypothetical protein [Pasteurella multocida]NNI65579.1 hypothetical protein [Pasteurella multocida]GJJ80747.1 hypothetical protein PcPA57_14670 [Pasteurella canis]